jgi:hypothetical protein
MITLNKRLAAIAIGLAISALASPSFAQRSEDHMSAGRCDDRSFPLIGNDGDLDLALLGLRTCLHVTNEGVGSEQLKDAPAAAPATTR